MTTLNWSQNKKKNACLHSHEKGATHNQCFGSVLSEHMLNLIYLRFNPLHFHCSQIKYSDYSKVRPPQEDFHWYEHFCQIHSKKIQDGCCNQPCTPWSGMVCLTIWGLSFGWVVIFEILGDRYYCFMFSLSSVSPNHSLSDDNIGAMGISRSTTSSPVPQSMQSTAWITCRRMIYIKSNPPSGHWPVPESFWPDPSMQALVCMFYELF